MDLHVHWLGNCPRSAESRAFRISLAHYRGPPHNLLVEPEMEVVVDPIAHTAHALSYQHDGRGVCQHIDDVAPDKVAGLSKSMDAILLAWLTDLRARDYVLAESR